ncbi:MAG: hypothetical protein PVI23_04785 [Maricaulaceae bacterium]|jgi:hypothetical protein
MERPPLDLDARITPDPIDPGIVHAPANAAFGLIQSGPQIKACIRAHAFTPAERRAALWLSPDGVVALHDAVERTLAQLLPAGEDRTEDFRALFASSSAPAPIVDALVRLRRQFFASTGAWPRKIISRCHAPLFSMDEFNIVPYAHFDSYEDRQERYVMIAVLCGAGPVLIRNPNSEVPSSLEPEVFTAYAERLRAQYGAIEVRPGSVVMKKANHRGSSEFADLLPHLSGRVPPLPFWGKRVAFTLS